MFAKIWLKIKVLFYFKSFSFVSSCINEIHIFCFPSKPSFRFSFHSIFHSVPFSVPRFSNTRHHRLWMLFGSKGSLSCHTKCFILILRIHENNICIIIIETVWRITTTGDLKINTTGQHNRSGNCWPLKNRDFLLTVKMLFISIVLISYRRKVWFMTAWNIYVNIGWYYNSIVCKIAISSSMKCKRD